MGLPSLAPPNCCAISIAIRSSSGRGRGEVSSRPISRGTIRGQLLGSRNYVRDYWSVRSPIRSGSTATGHCDTPHFNQKLLPREPGGGDGALAEKLSPNELSARIMIYPTPDQIAGIDRLRSVP